MIRALQSRRKLIGEGIKFFGWLSIGLLFLLHLYELYEVGEFAIVNIMIAVTVLIMSIGYWLLWARPKIQKIQVRALLPLFIVMIVFGLISIFTQSLIADLVWRMSMGLVCIISGHVNVVAASSSIT